MTIDTNKFAVELSRAFAVAAREALLTVANDQGLVWEDIRFEMLPDGHTVIAHVRAGQLLKYKGPYVIRNGSQTTIEWRCVELAPTPKIYIYSARNDEWTPDLAGVAIAEDGTYLAHHVSSNLTWLKHDMGLESDWKHESYKAHYPGGYTLELVDNVETHEGLQEALRLNSEQGK